MADKKYFAIEQTGGVPTNVQEISSNRYTAAIEKVVEPEKPGKKIGVIGRNEGYQFYGKLSNYGSTAKFNWAVYKGDAFVADPIFIDGSNNGDLPVSAGEFSVNLFEKSNLLEDGAEYRIYVADHDNVDETRGFADFIYTAPEEESKGNTGTPKPEKPIDSVTPSAPVQPGEIKALKVNLSSDLRQVPSYTLPSGAINILASDTPWDIQVDFARRGMITHVHLSKLMDEMGGGYHPIYQPNGVTWDQVGVKLAEYNLPKTIGYYRMAYENMIRDLWPQGSYKPTSQQAVNERVEGFIMGIVKAVGWDDGVRQHILDIDWETEDFFRYGSIDPQCEAIRYSLFRNPNLRIQAFATSHTNASQEWGGSPQNPEKQVGSGYRFEMFKRAGVSIFAGTAPYFHFPDYEWPENPEHYTSVIGQGKAFPTPADYAANSIKFIHEKIKWNTGYFANLPAGHKPANIEWYMASTEGGAADPRHWPMIGPWMQESFPLWAGVGGSYRFGGGGHLWVDGRPWNEANYAFELGKSRLYAYNEFHENADKVIWDIALEFSLDGGVTWLKDTDPRGGHPEYFQDPKGFARGAFLNGKLWIVAMAGQPFHLNGKSQSVIIRYQGKQIPFTLASQTVHSFTVEI